MFSVYILSTRLVQTKYTFELTTFELLSSIEETLKPTCVSCQDPREETDQLCIPLSL